jgi:thioredoxin reductase (NADPH)
VSDADVDVLFAGAGLAGLTAGMFSARYGRQTTILTGGVPGGPLLSVTKIEDYPGFPEPVAGFELCPAVQEQAAAAGAAFRMDELEGLELEGDTWIAATTSGPVRARAVIVATGSRPRPLDVPGEEVLAGKGVSHCASCDGPLFRERVAAVIGGGDSALQEALELAEHVGEVVVFHRGASFTAQDAYQRRVLESPRIQVRFGVVIEEILGEGAVEGVRVRTTETGDVEVVELAAVFPCIGAVPRTAVLADVATLDADGRVPTDGGMRTDARGIFAAGDIRRDSAAHAVAVAGDGATAAASAHAYLDDGAWPGRAAAATERALT